MSIKITKKDVEKAKIAHEAVLKKDPDFRAYAREIEKMIKETIKQREKEVK